MHFILNAVLLIATSFSLFNKKFLLLKMLVDKQVVLAQTFIVRTYNKLINYPTTSCQHIDLQLIKSTFQININKLFDTLQTPFTISTRNIVLFFCKLLIRIYVAFLQNVFCSIWLQHCTCCSFLYNNRLIRYMFSFRGYIFDGLTKYKLFLQVRIC